MTLRLIAIGFCTLAILVVSFVVSLAFLKGGADDHTGEPAAPDESRRGPLVSAARRARLDPADHSDADLSRLHDVSVRNARLELDRRRAAGRFTTAAAKGFDPKGRMN